MKRIVILSVFLLSNFTLAETMKSRLHAVDSSHLRLENGRVVFLTQKNTDQFDSQVGNEVEVVTNEQNELVSMKSLGSSSHRKLLSLQEGTKPPFTPTVLAGMADVNAMYDRLNPKFRRISECTDRAHVWAFDEFKANGIMSQKVFIFFTASYINRNHFKWWFHVAPLVSVNGSEPRVMDYRYMDHAGTIKEWTDMLVFSKRDCKMTDRFSEYDVNPQTEDCYMMIDSMYYRLPGELASMEQGIYRSQWNESEVRGARSRAFREGEL